MKKLILLIMAACALYGCKEFNAPENTYKKPTTYQNGYTVPSVNFTYKIVSPRQVVFTYKCTSDIAKFEWDFGDGVKDTQNKGISHTYKNAGTYTVYLRGWTATGTTTYEYKETFTLKNPTGIFISGFTFNQVPYTGKYWRVYMYDDDWFTTSWKIKSGYTYEALVNNNLPFTLSLYEPAAMDHLSGDNYYNIEVYYNDIRSGDGTMFCKTKLYKTNILEYYPGYKFSNNNLSFTVNMSYTY